MATHHIRCAIYTRKSSDDGLDQDFNSLDAQYEACTAYIASQRLTGWTLVADRFDDGGLSGGTLERPALQRLLAEIDAGRIGMVVVYKIDRLTRSLADFVRLVERLEAKGCSFVSVTQAFNTSSSMGRLTLNVLLSFAQFEREVTAERIRDKIAASKKKGLWMGGSVPFGYDTHPDKTRRELVVRQDEAAVVKRIFTLYAKLQNLSALEQAVAAEGLVPRAPKRRATNSVAISDAVGHDASSIDDHAKRRRRFLRGQLHYLLTNPVYIGRIRHKDKTYDGLHDSIICKALWDDVQRKLLSAKARPRGKQSDGLRADQSTAVRAPLMGKLRDDQGDLLTPTHTKRKGRRFSYYVSNRLITGHADDTAWRLSAPVLEKALRQMVANHVISLVTDHRLCATPDLRASGQLQDKADALLAKLEDQPVHFAKLIESGSLCPDGITLTLRTDVLAKAFAIDPSQLSDAAAKVAASILLPRRGIEAKRMIGALEPKPDPTLIRVLSEARQWAKDLKDGHALSDIAGRSRHSPSYIRTRLPIAFLAPDLQRAIITGKHRPDLTLAKLLRDKIPMDWQAQRAAFY